MQDNVFYVFICLSTYACIYTSIYVSVYPSIYLSIFLHVLVMPILSTLVESKLHLTLNSTYLGCRMSTLTKRFCMLFPAEQEVHSRNRQPKDDGEKDYWEEAQAKPGLHSLSGFYRICGT